MTNSELITELFNLFKDYFTFLFPVFGYIAGVWIVIHWINCIVFRPFKNL